MYINYPDATGSALKKNITYFFFKYIFSVNQLNHHTALRSVILSKQLSCSRTSFTYRDTVNNEEGINVNQQQAYW